MSTFGSTFGSTFPRRHLASLATLALVGALGLSACGSDDSATDPASGPVTGATDTSSPSASESSTASASASASGGSDGTDDDPAPAGTVPVYYAGDTPQGTRLFREFRKVSGDLATGAASMAVSGVPLDPDYRTLFPTDAGIASVSHDGDRITVTVEAGTPTDRPSGMSRKTARLAVQALIYTAQGALQSRDPVTVVDASGSPVRLLGIDTADGLGNAPQLNVLALVNVTAPEQDSTEPATFTASGVASSPEGNVPWQVSDSSGKVVKQGFATAEGYMGQLFPWEVQVDLSGLPAGQYTFEASTDDQSGGEGFDPTSDTKAFTLKP
ncbi:Gmad2 immunoglobulin-like domain-containing protein [Nocardioides acrostichi]|uniref:GerMN domain-containing protein n=1 Tax=Nocardioides acrostichi TaxID=2784339 RepID=A0A930Y8S8_9ACTN|nr:Gmad2 immunoglobulin-like domain-containing protein [Nocardioides acrostichi]MBF4163386.1 GerMN domain-containing protein [Nocardioides acrostichi]